LQIFQRLYLGFKRKKPLKHIWHEFKKFKNHPWYFYFFVNRSLGSLRHSAMSSRVNEVDRAWGLYKRNKDVTAYKGLIEKVKSGEVELSTVESSVTFGALYQQLSSAHNEFFVGKEDALLQLSGILDGQSTSYKSALAEFYAISLSFKELTVQEIATQDIYRLEKNSFLKSEDWRNLLDVLNRTELEKIFYLKSRINSNSRLRIGGSFFFDASFIRATYGETKFYIISIQTPMDAIFVPCAGFLIKSNACALNVKERVQKLLRWSVSLPDDYINCWSKLSEGLTWLVKNNRPFHVVADELSAYFYLKHEYGIETSVAFHSRSAFFELDSIGETISRDSLQQFSATKTLISSLRRLPKRGGWAFDYRKWLIKRAHELYKLPEKERYWFWIGISGSEKRVWLEEREAICGFVRLCKEKYQNCYFIFEGWTSSSVENKADLLQEEAHTAFLNDVLRHVDLDENEYISIVGAQVFKKLAFAAKCDFFISSAGTPAIWPSTFCQIPGVVHNSTQMIDKLDSVLFLENVVKVPLDIISDVGVGEKDRWDYVNYSIQPDRFLDVCSIEMGRHLD